MVWEIKKVSGRSSFFLSFFLSAAYLLKLCLIFAAFAFSLKNPLIKYFVIEVTVLCAILLFIPRRRVRLFLVLPVVVMALQLVNVLATGKYLDSLTLLNLDSGHLISWSQYLVMGALLTFFLLSFLPDLLLKTGAFIKLSAIRRYTAAALLLILLLAGEVCSDSLPFSAFCSTGKIVCQQLLFQPSYHDDGSFLSHKIHGSDVSEKYQTAGKNIILIFTEGLSAEVLSDELTPNIMKIKRESFDFINYYNHTAATYRGIRGSLISGYMAKGGFYNTNDGLGQITQQELEAKFANSVESVPFILGKNGYKTVFLSPHPRHKDNFSNFIKLIGFQEVKVSESNAVLSDREQFERLFQTAADFHGKNTRFFLGMYNIETHEGMDVRSHIFKDGKNLHHNKFHNYDHWFGKFYEKFKTSPLADDTILIFTTDHATYNTQQYKESFNSRQEYFANKIPLCIWWKDIKPEKFDVQTNSLSLAPTILDLCGIKEVDNHFLGASVFAEKRTIFEKYIYNNLYLKISDDGIVPLKKNRTRQDKKVRSLIKKYFDIAG